MTTIQKTIRVLGISTSIIVMMPILGTTMSAQAATYTASDVSTHNTASNCWVIIDSKVYNMTSFISSHPGGSSIIIAQCGKDATTVFDSGPHPASGNSDVLASLLLGDLVTSNTGQLTTPTGLTGVPSNTSISLTWTASSGGTAPITYTVLRNGAPVTTTLSTSFPDTGLATSTTYTYAVIARDSASPTPNTATSSSISVTTGIPTTFPPSNDDGDDESNDEYEHVGIGNRHDDDNDGESEHHEDRPSSHNRSSDRSESRDRSHTKLSRGGYDD